MYTKHFMSSFVSVVVVVVVLVEMSCNIFGFFRLHLTNTVFFLCWRNFVSFIALQSIAKFSSLCTSFAIFFYFVHFFHLLLCPFLKIWIVYFTNSLQVCIASSIFSGIFFFQLYLHQLNKFVCSFFGILVLDNMKLSLVHQNSLHCAKKSSFSIANFNKTNEFLQHIQISPIYFTHKYFHQCKRRSAMHMHTAHFSYWISVIVIFQFSSV